MLEYRNGLYPICFKIGKHEASPLSHESQIYTKIVLREQNFNGAKMNAQRPNGILITAEQRST
jgi:hypothetical protein